DCGRLTERAAIREQVPTPRREDRCDRPQLLNQATTLNYIWPECECWDELFRLDTVLAARAACWGHSKATLLARRREILALPEWFFPRLVLWRPQRNPLVSV